MLSSVKKLHITDLTLSAVYHNGLNAQYVREFYESLLELGITYVQMPIMALDAVGHALIPSRTVLEIPTGWTDIPSGFGGYIGSVSEIEGRTVCEAAIGGDAPCVVDEVRVTADAALFWADYLAVFNALIKDPRSSLCVRDAKELGTALTVEWVLAGGKNIAASFSGAGGYAPLEEVLVALHVTGQTMESVRLDQLRFISKAFERMTGRAIPAHKAAIGAGLFDVESGVHVDGLAKNRQCYEPFSPETVGAQRRFVIGKHSGKRALSLKLEELGLPANCDLKRLLELVREESIRAGGAVDNDTFARLVRRVLEEAAA